MQTVKDMLKRLEYMIREEYLTPAKTIDSETVFCATERTAQGIVYHQYYFGALKKEYQDVLRGKERGQIAKNWKIIAIYHVWDDIGPSIWSVKKI